jgi:transcriptional regulator with XRE-family HTH domain
MLLGQSEFARTLGVSDRTIYYWEKGERSPSFEQLRNLVEKTGKDAAYFLDDQEAVA